MDGACRGQGAGDSFSHGISFELIPIKNLEHQLPLLPPGSKVSVTCSPAKGVDVTMALAARLQGLGLQATPHVAARMVRDPSHLAELVAVSTAAGLREWFVVGGDAEHPVGAYSDGLALLQDLVALPHGLNAVGVPAYPDGHVFINHATVTASLHAKQAVLADAGVAGWVSTQLCFDPDVIRRWLQTERAAGLALPVRLGLSGPVERTKLLTLGMRVGVGQSLRYLRKNRRGVGGLLGGDGYDPDHLLEALRPDLETFGVNGIHLFTFNQLGAAVDWQRSLAA
jgi:methylenetetrahydrofolate reductase (NADPH)